MAPTGVQGTGVPALAPPQVNGESGDNFQRMPDAKSPNDRRTDVRIDVSFPIKLEIQTNGARTPAVVENVSLGGVLLRTETSLPLQTKVVLEIQSGDAPPLRVPATVVRFTGAQSYGTAFVTLSEADADRLMALTSDFLRAAAPTPWYLG